MKAITQNLITMTLVINRERNVRDAIYATKCDRYSLEIYALSNMLNTTSTVVKTVLFKPEYPNSVGRISDEDLVKEYESRYCLPADLMTLAALNEKEPSFALLRPNGTHYKDASGNWLCAGFSGVGGNRVSVVQKNRSLGWAGNWWFLGVLKT